jgi:hypothetical protein
MSMPDLFRAPGLGITGTGGMGPCATGPNPSYYNYLACLPPPLPSFSTSLFQQQPQPPFLSHGMPYNHGGAQLMQVFPEIRGGEYSWMTPLPSSSSSSLPRMDFVAPPPAPPPQCLLQHLPEPQLVEQQQAPALSPDHATGMATSVKTSRDPPWTPKVPLLCTPAMGTRVAPAPPLTGNTAGGGGGGGGGTVMPYAQCNMCEFDFEQSDAYQGDCLLCPACRAKKIVRLCWRVGGKFYAVWGRRGKHVRNLTVPEMDAGVLYMVTEPVDSSPDGIANAHSSITLLKIDHGGDLAVFQLFREYVMTSRTMSLWSNDRQELFVEEYAPKVGRATSTAAAAAATGNASAMGVLNRGLNPFYQFKVQLILPRGKYGAIMNAPLRFFTVLPSSPDHPGSPPRTAVVTALASASSHNHNNNNASPNTK